MKNRIIVITDFHAPELDVYARLTEAQLLNKDNPQEGMFIAESPKVIGRALDAGSIWICHPAQQVSGHSPAIHLNFL